MLATRSANQPEDLANTGETEVGNNPSDLLSPLHQPGSGKKKKKKRGPTALTKNRGTGFEEYYADPPITPKEADEERNEIYHPERPFVDRIEECIQRFRSRRRLNPVTTKYFDHYLFLGGIDTSPRQFAGLDHSDMRDMTPAEKRDLTATDVVHQGASAGDRYYNDSNAAHWDVDFTGIVSGYISDVVPHMASGDEHQAIAVIENFLRYVLQHEVCAEHAHDVKAAMAVCALARTEFLMVDACRVAFPGQFNLAAAELYCQEGTYTYMQPDGGFRRPDDFDPNIVFRTGVTLAGTPEQYDRLRQAVTEIYVVGEHKRDLEVVEIHRPEAGLADMFRGLRVSPDAPVGIAPVGSAVFRPYVIEDGWYHPSRAPADPDERMTLLLDDAILAAARPGFKFRLVVCELNIGVSFIKQSLGVFPSFHTFLPQQLMLYYKAPVVNERPPPSVTDPMADERELTKECEAV